MIAEASRSSRSSSCLRKVALVWTGLRGVSSRRYLSHVTHHAQPPRGPQPYLPHATILSSDIVPLVIVYLPSECSSEIRYRG
jgi:hypothetical protein